MSRRPAAERDPGDLALSWGDAYRLLGLPPGELLKQCRQDRYQGPGPGGQKRNRVYSGIRLTHAASGLQASTSARREARRNLEDALHRLRLELALAPPWDGEIGHPGTVGASAAFRADANPRNEDFPRFALLALHWLAWSRGRTVVAAGALDCTASALVRFLKGDKALWVRFQSIRERNGLRPLK